MASPDFTFLLVLGPEDVLALSKNTIGTAWASRVFFSKNYDSNGFFEFSKKNVVEKNWLGVRNLDVRLVRRQK